MQISRSLAFVLAVFVSTIGILPCAMSRPLAASSERSGNAVWLAAIFGDNNLDDLPGLSLCDSPLGQQAPPVGWVVQTRGSERLVRGSGSLVQSGGIVVTAGHLFRSNNWSKIFDGDQIIFTLAERFGDECRLVDYPVKSVTVGTMWPDYEADRDFAVLRLIRPVDSYLPLMADLLPADINRIIESATPVILQGFAQHPSTQNGHNISIISCNIYSAPKTGSQYSGNSSVLFHDCDSAPGMSGGALTLIEQTVGEDGPVYLRHLIGIHVGTSTSESNIKFDVRRDYNVAAAFSEYISEIIQCTGSDLVGNCGHLLYFSEYGEIASY